MKNRLIYTLSCSALAAGLLIACGNGDDDDTTPPAADGGTDAGTTKQDAATGTDASPSPDSSTPPQDASAGDAATAPTFTEVYAQIISGVCATCHGSANGSGAKGGKLIMDNQADAYSALVGVAANGEACSGDGTRVVAGSAATSILWEKVSETSPPCGSRMPLGDPPLAQADQDLIKDWINAGALNN